MNMRRRLVISGVWAAIACIILSFSQEQKESYNNTYLNRIKVLSHTENELLNFITNQQTLDSNSIVAIKAKIDSTRLALKSVDFWLRYLDPLAYKNINSPLPVEWETEVFEKFEKPYKRIGAGLTLSYLYLDEQHPNRDTLAAYISKAVAATDGYLHDSITRNINSYHHFYLCNRLYLLNLAAIYTTGFECPNTDAVIPELKNMIGAVNGIYASFNNSFPETALPDTYTILAQKMQNFVAAQPNDYTQFDHYNFIRNYVNPLFAINQELILKYSVTSRSNVDYSLNKNATSIFDKKLYNGQNAKGIYLRVKDSTTLAEIEHVGKLLFYDPILSGNNMRSCGSCHKPTQYFTDTTTRTAINFSRTGQLARNTPSLINAGYNHLLMLDGKHISMQDQGKDVMTNADEMAGEENEILKKVLSCGEYKNTFKKLLKYTPQEPEITFEHIVSAISFYYNKFSQFTAPLDDAMNNKTRLTSQEVAGFNVYMSKAQCATCHFVPQFNGVKPPYVGSEFEVLGVPNDTGYKALSPDKGRYVINAATETHNAFRTGSIRNATHTAPYMHNGIFKSMEQVIDFYDGGGGAGRGLFVPNQTLSADSLHLTTSEKANLIAFIQTLNERIAFEAPPATLPQSKIKALNIRKPVGEY